MRNAECGMRNCNAEVGPGMRPVEPMPALQFRIPHSALRIKWPILAEHTLGSPAESIPGIGCPCSLLPAPLLPLQPPLPAPRSLLPISSVTKTPRNESFLTYRRLADLRRCDPDYHEVVADLLHTATVRTATTGRPGARLVRGAALRAGHGGDRRSGPAPRKSADRRELMPVRQ